MSAQALSSTEFIEMRKLLVVLGIPIDDLNMDEALARIEAFVKRGRATGKSHQIATVNADFVVKALHDPELRYLLQEADMATADGMPLVWGARLLGVPLEGRVTGADLVPALAERAAEKGYSLFLLGAGPGVAQQAAEVLRQRHPQLKIAGVLAPPYASVLEMDPAIVEEIRKARPDILLVAFGNPKQEKWIGMYGPEVGVPVMIGVGGTLDFIAGKTQRAPRWMQRLGLEWFYRLLQEPGRLWRRYVVDLLGFSSFFIRQWWAMRRRILPPTLLPASELVLVEQGRDQQPVAVLNIQGRLDAQYSDGFSSSCQRALSMTPNIIINLAEADFLDSSAIGTLVGLAKRAREAGGQLRLAAVPEPIRRSLTLLRLDRFFLMDDHVEQGLQVYGSARSEDEQLWAEGEWTVFRLPRRLDASTAPQVTESCEAIVEANPFLVLDFGDTVFLASAGLAAMARLNRLATGAGGQVRLAHCSDDVLRVIRMVRFDQVLDLYDTVADATNAAVGQRRATVGGV